MSSVHFGDMRGILYAVAVRANGSAAQWHKARDQRFYIVLDDTGFIPNFEFYAVVDDFGTLVAVR